jgi:4-amino-4-deoxy-L-arabinose transferase-like glycosyltransferase
MFIFAPIFVFFLWLCCNRLIALDEGFYVIAAQLISHGKIPYTDFFYPQAPILPYLYAGWMQIFGYDWYAARALAALFSSGIVFVLYLLLKERYGRLIAFLGALCLALNAMFWPWMLVVKTYAPATFFLLLAYYLVTSARSQQRLLIAGISIGLGIGCRLYLAALVPLFLVLFLKDRAFFKSFLVGGFLTSLPFIALAAFDWPAFWYNNMGYHLSRSPGSFSRSLPQKWDIVANLFGITPTLNIERWGLPVFTWLATLNIARTLLSQRAPSLAAGIIIVLGCVSLLPQPTYDQYFCIIVPFIIIEAIACLQWMQRLCPAPKLAVGALSVCLALALFLLPDQITRYTQTGVGVTGIQNRQEAQIWQIPAIQTVRDEVNAVTQPGTEVLALWPGYLLGSHAQPLPGTENHFGRGAAKQFTAAERIRFKVLSITDMEQVVKEKKVSVLVLRTDPATKVRLRRPDFLEENGFYPISKASLVQHLSPVASP